MMPVATFDETVHFFIKLPNEGDVVIGNDTWHFLLSLYRTSLIKGWAKVLVMTLRLCFRRCAKSAPIVQGTYQKRNVQAY